MDGSVITCLASNENAHERCFDERLNEEWTQPWPKPKESEESIKSRYDQHKGIVENTYKLMRIIVVGHKTGHVTIVANDIIVEKFPAFTFIAHRDSPVTALQFIGKKLFISGSQNGGLKIFKSSIYVEPLRREWSDRDSRVYKYEEKWDKNHNEEAIWDEYPKSKAYGLMDKSENAAIINSVVDIQVKYKQKNFHDNFGKAEVLVAVSFHDGRIKLYHMIVKNQYEDVDVSFIQEFSSYKNYTHRGTVFVDYDEAGPIRFSDTSTFCGIVGTQFTKRSPADKVYYDHSNVVAWRCPIGRGFSIKNKTPRHLVSILGQETRNQTWSSDDTCFSDFFKNTVNKDHSERDWLLKSTIISSFGSRKESLDALTKTLHSKKITQLSIIDHQQKCLIMSADSTIICLTTVTDNNKFHKIYQTEITSQNVNYHENVFNHIQSACFISNTDPFDVQYPIPSEKLYSSGALTSGDEPAN